MVQTKLSWRPKPKKSKSPVTGSDDDIVMTDLPESSPRPRTRSAAKGRTGGGGDDGRDRGHDTQNDDADDDDMAKVTNKTRLLLVAVEVPKKQRSLTNYFSPKSSGVNVEVRPAPKSPTRRSKGKGKAVAVISKPSTSRRQSRKKIIVDSSDEQEEDEDNDDDDDDDEYVADKEVVESEFDDDVESDLQDASAESDLQDGTDDETGGSQNEMPAKKGKVQTLASQGGKKKKMSYTCIPKPCGIKVESRLEDQPGGLPPVSNLTLIFDDIISRVLPSVAKLMGPNKHRKLRVATMCSGTESPLLALGMFSKAIKERGMGHLEIEHVFSCEIEPYKQAYIERNFKPPILFRDIKEMGNEFATTAYGAMVKVPGDVDILIAGTSCVDFSNLNNKQKSLEEGGESGDTFLGMMRWVDKHRPLIVIQENVCGAAWGDMREFYHRCDYDAEYTRFDSKKYYIPHTRMRGYMFAVNVQGLSIPNKWIDAVKKMERRCTTTLEAFMLPDDDPRVYKARMQLAGDPRRTGPIKARTVDWEKCEGRHQRERITKKLGDQRPVTAWQEGGVCKTLDFMWQDWGRKQVERVLDLMDINFLLSVRDGYDPMYKAAFWNLSQNVDRNTMGGKPDGISPCLTPHMIAYLCYRGGPMTGIEALHMQGLPIDELLLTRETSQQIQDLAGNAMSSTVVGTAILCALILSMEHLQDRSSDEDAMALDEPSEINNPIVGEDELEESAMDLSTTDALELRDLLVDAEKSRRVCVCEGRFSITTNKIRLCTECGFTACDKCGGRPSHEVPENQDPIENRLQPLEFEAKLKSILSMRLRLTGIDDATFQKLKPEDDSIRDLDWKIWSELAVAAFKGEFRFKNLLRQETWTVTYDAPDARLELILNTKKPEWRIFAKCPMTEGITSEKRRLSARPIARMLVHGQAGKGALEGQWELCLPAFPRFDILVQGIDAKVPSWQSTLGYTDSATMTSEVYGRLRFTVPDEHKAKFDQDISGEYKLLQNCGTALGSLHKRIDDDGAVPLFCFIDQKRTGDGSNDSFVFASDHRRLGYGEYRPLTAYLAPTWRQRDATAEPRKVATLIDGQWVPVKARLGPPPVSQSAKDGILSVPGPDGLNFQISKEDCGSARTVLQCKVPLRGQVEAIWPRGKWIEVDSIHERATYESLAWLTERVRSLKQLEQWTTLELPECGLDGCNRCAPPHPQLKWLFVKNKFKPFEDPQQAAPYERALKARPSPFVTHVKLDDGGAGVLKIGLNVATLVHRALFRMPAEVRGAPLLSWRLVTDYIPEPRLLLPFYSLASNKNDVEAEQPPNFITPLRPEQLRSLSWMKEQEKEDVIPFMEEEVAEVLLPHLNWRAEGKAERPNYVWGGVLADEVGYGKTAITLGLIDSTHHSIKLPDKMPGAIPIKATLVVIPSHLAGQWTDEIKKFTGTRYKVIKILSQADLNKVSVKEMMQADIVVASAPIFQSDKYISNLALFAGTATAAAGQGRRFFEWQRQALVDLAVQVDHIREMGAAGAWARIDEASRRLGREANEPAEVFVQKKRLTGSAYAKSKEQTGSKRMRSTDDDDSDVDSVSEEGTSSDRAKKSRQSMIGRDPWKLKNHLVQKDWTRMVTPPFEMFQFNRLVVDEFTYYNGQIHAGIISLKARYRWVLSGTPPLDDFEDVKTIAAFLNIHLGIEDDQVGKDQNKKRIQKDMTVVELFTNFREIHSPYWHTRRQQVAQAFLNQFVRQNYAEIDEIPYQEFIVPVKLPAAERAIYLELEHYLQALDYNLKRSKHKMDNDRDRRQQEALGDSETAEEALIKRCSHFDLDGSRSNEDNAVQACDVIVEERKKQLHSCCEDIRRSLKDALTRYKQISSKEWQADTGARSNDKRPKNLFMEFVEQCRTGGVGDPDANHDIKALLEEAFAAPKSFKVVYADGSVADPKISAKEPPSASNKKGKKAKVKVDEAVDETPLDTLERIEQLKSKVIYLRGLARKELAGRHRSLRYFTVVRDLQKSALPGGAVVQVTCPGCKRSDLELSEIAVLSSCGHKGCYDCLREAARLTQCLTEGCQAATRALAVVKADSLGAEDKRDGIGRHHGKKLEKIVELIKNHIPKNEKVLLFIQFGDLMTRAQKILTASGIKWARIEGNSKKKSTTVQDFQNDQGENSAKVMILNVTAESSSGSNFTVANHAIFLSPLLTTTDYEYQSSETQAIGRIRRYGQTRKVHIWRFMSEDTMDVEIYEGRTGEKRDSDSFKAKIYEV